MKLRLRLRKRRRKSQEEETGGDSVINKEGKEGKGRKEGYEWLISVLTYLLRRREGANGVWRSIVFSIGRRLLWFSC